MIALYIISHKIHISSQTFLQFLFLGNFEKYELAIAISVNPHTLSFVIIINSLVHTVQAVSGITDDRILVYTRV